MITECEYCGFKGHGYQQGYHYQTVHVKNIHVKIDVVPDYYGDHSTALVLTISDPELGAGTQVAFPYPASPDIVKVVVHGEKRLQEKGK